MSGYSVSEELRRRGVRQCPLEASPGMKMSKRRDARRERRAAAEASLRLVRVCWRDGHASADDVMWARSVSDLVAAAPVHLAMKYLRDWDAVVLGSYSEHGADRVRREAESRGHGVELLTTSTYTAAYVASALGCSAIEEDTLRVTFLPSFHPEGVVTARRTPDTWHVELRVSRESLWYSRFSEVPFGHWDSVRRCPGVDVRVTTKTRDAAAAGERALSAALENRTASPLLGADGMTVHVASRLAAATFDEEGWCPQIGTHVRAAADLALLLAASNEVTDWETAVRAYLL